MKVDLDNVELNTIIQAMAAVTIKGKDAIKYGKLMTKLQTYFDKAHAAVEKAEKNG